MAAATTGGKFFTLQPRHDTGRPAETGGRPDTDPAVIQLQHQDIGPTSLLAIDVHNNQQRSQKLEVEIKFCQQRFVRM